MAAQRATLQEQRTHIDILDTALTNAQANVVRLEDEVPAPHALLVHTGTTLYTHTHHLYSDTANTLKSLTLH